MTWRLQTGDGKEHGDGMNNIIHIYIMIIIINNNKNDNNNNTI